MIFFVPVFLMAHYLFQRAGFAIIPESKERKEVTNMNVSASWDITRVTLAVLFIGVLIAASFWLLRPFLTSFIWATIIVVATWPLLLKLQSWLWHKRGLAVAVMSVILLLVLVIPLSLAILSIIDSADEIATRVKSLSTFSVPPMPEWVGKIPLVGKKVAERWQQYAALPPDELSARLTPYAKNAISWFIAKAGSIGMMILQFILMIIISAILYSNGETAASGVRKFARRLAGAKGEETAVLASKAVRGVALGVVLTAIIQTVLAGIGLVVTGVPTVAILTAVIFILCIAQIGPAIIMILSIIWLFYSGQTLWGSVLIAWSIPVVLIDNVIRPVLIKKGADLPLLLIFAGVIGGLIAFGVIGLFIGPVVLAVSHVLLKAWVSEGESERKSTDIGS
jgi:predicted PurR-regulated permease PerM